MQGEEGERCNCVRVGKEQGTSDSYIKYLQFVC